MPEPEENVDHPMDEEMPDPDADQIGPLWIRRQVFEHSVAVPLLTTTTASQIDFPRLAAELRAVAVPNDPQTPPAVSYEAWVTAAGLHARLDSSEDAGIIIEALETNAPDAFVRCNDPAKLAPGRQLPYRLLHIPVPELLTFIKLHAASTISSRFRETADAVWVESGETPIPSSPPVSNAASPFASQGQSTIRSESPQMISLPATNGNSANRVPNHMQQDETLRPRNTNISSDSSPASALLSSSAPLTKGREQSPLESGTMHSLSGESVQKEEQNQMKDQQSEAGDHQGQTPSNNTPDIMQDLTLTAGKQSPKESTHEHAEGVEHKGNQSPIHNLTLNTQAIQNPLQGSPLPTSPGIDGIVRKKTPTYLGAMINSQSAILASDNHAFQRETRLVVNNLKAFLLIIASAYGVGPDIGSSQTDSISPESGIVMGGGAVAAESGTLSREAVLGRPRRSNSIGSSTDSVMSDDQGRPTRNMLITRQMFEHLSFLLTTTVDPSGTYRPVSWIVPQWRDPANTNGIPLGELVDILTTALTRVTITGNLEGSTDVAEIRDLDRKTILRSNIPTTNASATQYPHAKEVRIQNCTECHFYLACTLGRVSLIACKDCTVFVGACVSISIINCVNMRVHAISRVCRVTNSLDTRLYICTNRFPQIVGENRGLLFAPYNAACNRETAQQYLEAIGINANANVWDKFYRPAHRTLSATDRQDPDLTPAVAKVLPPDQFLPFAIPLRNLEPSSALANNANQEQNRDSHEEREAFFRPLFDVPLPLPPEYEQNLIQKKEELDKFSREIRACEKKVPGQAMEGENPSERGAMDREAAYANESTMNERERTHDHTSMEKESNMEQEAANRESDVAMTDNIVTSSPKHGSDDGDQSPTVVRKGVVHALIQERFREWLNHSGRMKQIQDLLRQDQVDQEA